MFLISFLSTLPAFAQPATNDPVALVPAYGEIPPTFWEQHQTPIIIGIFALIAFAFLVLRVIIRPKSAVVLPPEVLAREALSKLAQQPEDGKLLSEVSRILRQYITTAFELPPAELTTAEFHLALAENRKIDFVLAEEISQFLRECDEQKFSSSPTATPFNVVTRALELISLSEKRRAELRAQTLPPR